MSEERTHTVTSLLGDLRGAKRLLTSLSAEDRNDLPARALRTLVRTDRALDRAGAYLTGTDTQMPTSDAEMAATLLGGDAARLRHELETLLETPISTSTQMRRASRLDATLKTFSNKLDAVMQSETEVPASGDGHSANQLTGQLGALRQEIEDLSKRLTTLHDSSEQRYLKLNEHSSSLEGAIDSRRQALDRLLADFDERFAKEQAARTDQEREREAREDKALSEFGNAATERLSKVDNVLNEARVALDQESTEIVDSLREKHEEALKLVDLVTTSATAGAFGKEADAQRAAADRWRKGALTLFVIAAVAAALFLALGVAAGSLSPTLLAAKATFVILMSGVAGFAVRQSSHHREREVQARKLYLQLTAFGPFTEPLGTDHGRDARADFIKRLFVGDQSANGNGKGLEGTDDPDFLKQVIDLLVQAPRRGKG